MTIDEKSFHFFFQSNPTKATELVNQVKEVTGSADEDIKRAFDQSKDSNGEFCLQGAVDYLLGSHGVVSTTTSTTTAVVPSYPSLPPPASSPQKTKVVDLTDDNKSEDDLQRAIALSLQDGGMVSQNTAATSTAVSGISQEEQDVSKALEASLRESSQVHRKKDSENPHDRQREGLWPVGLKNVGMTCWFSAVIQSLFHIPAFRTLVINYNPPSPDSVSENGRKVLEFMSELRKLFSLLLNSQRKYVDPSRAIELLRGSLGGESSQSFSNHQCHDVSEFTHKLLDWLEEAFNFRNKQKSQPLESVKCEGGAGEAEPMDSETEKMDKEKDSHCEPSPSPQKSSEAEMSGNPMCSLFYGQFEIEIRTQGAAEFRRRREKFGQWPLTVNEVSDIHDSLERSMAYQTTQSDEAGGVISGQERWFTSLPPVLFLELSRFQFNTSRVAVEKVNNTLEFGQEIYLDRYLEANKQLVREKREEVRKLVERREQLTAQLDCFLKFGSDQSQPESGQYPLVNILQSALEFAKSGETAGREAEGEVTMQVDSPCPSPASLTPASSLTQLPTPDLTSTSSPPGLEEMEATTSQDAMEVECEDNQHQQLTMQATVTTTIPRPKHVSEMEMKVLSSCFNRWIHEVEEDIARLSQALRDIEDSISVMYDEESLKMRGYRLHAVMVHGGDVNIGHYWAYVKHTERGWLKFNDNTVSQTTWEEIIQEAVGGKTTTSAYSLVYVDVARENLFTEAAAYLPADLDSFVMDDNKEFAAEILKWDEEKHRVLPEPSSDQSVLIGEDPECQIIEPDLSQSHALLAKEITMECLNTVAAERKKQDGKNPTSLVINKMYSQVKQKIQNAKLGEFGERNDPRLESFVHYLVANDLTIDHYKKALLEQVALKEFESLSDTGREVFKTARDALKNIEPKAEKEVVIWHRTYHQFRIVVNYFVLGQEKYLENSLEEALEMLTTSYVVNQTLEKEPPQPNVCKV